MSERQEQVEKIFLAALEAGPESYREIVEKECGDDTGIRREVESLLSHADSDGSNGFMDSKDAPGKGLLTELGAEALGAEEPMLPVDRKIGRYSVMGKLGAGGMGVVYVAQQDRPKRTVALKLMRVGGSERLLRRFEYEAEVLGRLHHPGIAQVFEAGTWEDRGLKRPYIVMELIRGESIIKHAETVQMPLRDKLELMAKVCDAVQHAHQAGIIHRDIKPGNILVDEGGQPKILDFGVARSVSEDPGVTTLQTGVGQIIGTIPYMSPEQVLADPSAIDTRADVYALGVVLYELLSGRLPHDLKSRSLPEAARIIRDDAPHPLSQINRVFRGDIDTIVYKALEKDRERRYQSAAALGEDLRRYLKGEPVLAKTDSAFYVLRKQLRRYRGVVLAASLFIIGVLAFGIVASFQAEKNIRLAGEKEEARQKSEQTSVQLADQLRTSTIENARLLAKTGYFAAAEKTMWREHLSDPRSLHTFWGLWEMYSEHQLLHFKIAHEPGLAWAAMSKSGLLYATCGQDKKATVWTLPGLEERRSFSFDTPGVTSGIDFGPDESMIAVCTANPPTTPTPNVLGDGTVILWDLRTGQEKGRSVVAVPQRKLAFSPTEPVFATVGDDGVLRFWSAADATPLKEYKISSRALVHLAFSADGKRIVASGSDSVVRVVDAANGQIVSALVGHGGGGVRAACLNHDGSEAYTGGWDRTIRRWKVATREQLANYSSPNGTIVCVSLSPDETSVVSGGWWRVEVHDAKTLARTSSFQSPSGIANASYSTDARFLAVSIASGEIRVWDLKPQGRIALPGHSGRVSASFGPTGRLVATGDSRGDLRLWELPSARLLAEWKGHTPNYRAKTLVFHPTLPWLLSAGEDRFLRIWDLNTGEIIREFRGCLDESAHAADFSKDGRYMAYISTDGTLSIIEIEGWRVRATLPKEGYGYISVRFSPDSQYVVTTNRSRSIGKYAVDGTRLAYQDPLGTTSGLTTPWSPSFSSDGSRMLMAHWTRDIAIMDPISLHRTGSLEGHAALVSGVEWCPTDDRLGVSASADGTVRLWDVDRQRTLVTFDAGGLIEAITVSFSPDGNLIAVGASEGTAFLLDLTYFERAMANHAETFLRREIEAENASQETDPSILAARAARESAVRAWIQSAKEKRWPRIGPQARPEPPVKHPTWVDPAVIQNWNKLKQPPIRD